MKNEVSLEWKWLSETNLSLEIQMWEGLGSHLIGDEWRIVASNQPGTHEHFYKTPFTIEK